MMKEKRKFIISLVTLLTLKLIIFFNFKFGNVKLFIWDIKFVFKIFKNKKKHNYIPVVAKAAYLNPILRF